MHNNQTNQTNQTNQANQPKVEVNPIKAPETNSDKSKEKNSKTIGVVVLVLIILGIIFLSGGKKTENLISTVEGCAEGDTFSQTTGEPCFEENTEPCKGGEEFNKETGEPCPVKDESATLLTPVVSTNAVLSGYETALAEYSSKRILFDANCVATPKILEVPVGTRVLVANNSTDKSLKIKVLDRTENLSALHYMLSSGFGTMGEYPVSCAGTVSATINVK